MAEEIDWNGFTPKQEKTAPVQPITRTLWDDIDAGRNWVGELIRDNISESVGSFIQPETVLRDGKIYSTENKTFNELSKENLIQELMSMEDKTGRGTGNIYVLENPTTGEIKFGRASGDTHDRYAGDVGFQQDWIPKTSFPVADAKKAERLIQGNNAILDSRVLNFGSAKDSSLQSGGTETYNSNELTQGVSKALEKMNPRTKAISKDFLGKALDIPKLSAEADLRLNKNFQTKANSALTGLGIDTTGMTPEQVSDAMVAELSGFNWNITDTANIATKTKGMTVEQAKNFLDVLESYDETDVNISQIGRGIKELLTDPTTYVGISTIGAGTAVSQGAKAIGKEALKNALKQRIKQGAAIGAIEGAIYTSADDLLKQTIEQDALKSRGYNFGQTGKNALIGAGLGGLLGGAIGGIMNRPKALPSNVDEPIPTAKADENLGGSVEPSRKPARESTPVTRQITNSDGSIPTKEEIDGFNEYKKAIDEIVKDTDMPEDVRRNFAKELRLARMYEDRGQIPSKDDIGQARLPQDLSSVPQVATKEVPEQYLDSPVEKTISTSDAESERIAIEQAQINDVQNPISSDEIPMGQNTNTFKDNTQQLTKEQDIALEKTANDFDNATADEKVAVGSFKFSPEQAMKAASQLDDANKILSEEETLLKKAAESAKLPLKERFLKNVNDLKIHLKSQIGKDEKSESFDKLFTNRRFKMDEVNIRAEKLKYKFDELMESENGRMWDDYFLKTDVHAIREFDRESAREFVKKHRNIYDKLRDQIDQSAKAVGDESEQIGHFMNNPALIAEHANMAPDVVPIINKLISIRAMELKGGKAAWEFLAEKRDTEAFKFAMDVITNNKRVSHGIFKGNPSKIVKGYIAEPFQGNKQIVGDKIMYDAETGFEPGAIPSNLEAGKVGYWLDKDQIREMYGVSVSGDTVTREGIETKEDLAEFAKKNKLKITDKGFRKVVDGETRDKAGRVHDFATRLTDTTTSIDAKVANREVVNDIIENVSNDDAIISVKEKEGFRELTDQERSNLPYELRDKIRFIDEDYAEKLLGRPEIRLYNGENQVAKIADRLWKDVVTNFKQNVVLKNPSSYKNAVLVNQTIASMAGVNPINLVKFQREAFNQSAETNRLRDLLTEAKATGRDTNAIEERLNSVLLYQMEKAGLSLNKLDGVRGDSSLLASILSDATGQRFDKIANELLLNQKGKTGKATVSVFSEIDTAGRYTIAKHYLEQGMSMDEAVKRANGLFADMDRMAPAMVEAIDSYGAVPFLKWFSNSSPMLMQITKENPMKALMVGIGVYALSSESDVNLSSVNPLEAMVDFADSAVSLDYIEAVEKRGLDKATIRKMTPYVVPNYMRDMYRFSTEENYNVLWKDRMEKPKGENSTDYRGLTQQLIEGD